MKNEAESVSIPYKYVVYKSKKNKYEFEFIYKLDSTQHTTNRCLFVKPLLVNDDGNGTFTWSNCNYICLHANGRWLLYYDVFALHTVKFLLYLFCKGDWHQYDDIICAEPTKNVLERIKEKIWPEQRKNLIQGREIAGNIMLETIFDLLRSWTVANLRSFLIQLNQFFQVYAEPFVYEEKQKKWYSLSYGNDDVSLEDLTLQHSSIIPCLETLR